MIATIAASAMSAALLCASRDARADVETNEERAERFFQDAEKKFDSGDVNGACALWADSLRLAPKLGTLLNMALCHEQQGRVATAWTEFHRGAAWAAQLGQKDRQEFAHAHAIVLEKKLPRILLQLPNAREIGTLELDGEPLPEQDWYLPIYLDPGDHTIAVSAPGKIRRTIGIAVLAGPSAQAVTIAPLADTPLPPQVAPPPPPKRSALPRIGGIALVAAGTGALAVGAYYDQDAVKSHGETTLPILAMGLGIGAIVGGGLTLFFASDNAPPRATPPAAASRFWLAPILDVRAPGLHAGYMF